MDTAFNINQNIQFRLCRVGFYLNLTNDKKNWFTSLKKIGKINQKIGRKVPKTQSINGWESLNPEP